MSQQSTHNKTNASNSKSNSNKGKKSGGGGGLFAACFGCGSSKAFADENERPNNNNKSKSNATTTTPKTGGQTGLNEKSTSAPATASTTTADQEKLIPLVKLNESNSATPTAAPPISDIEDAPTDQLQTGSTTKIIPTAAAVATAGGITALGAGAIAVSKMGDHPHQSATIAPTDNQNGGASTATATTTATSDSTLKSTTDEQAHNASQATQHDESTTTSSQQQPTVVVSPPSPSSGIALSEEETAGLTSGAVMAPGKEIGSTTTTKRSGGGGGGKRRKKKQQQQAVQSESIITQVPEPGQPIGVGRNALLMKQPNQDETDEDEESDEDDDEDDSEDDYDDDEEEEEEDEEQNLIARGGVGIPIGEDGLPHPLLDDLAPDLKGRKCLVLDLDETLVHSSFKMVHQADYVVPVEIENQYHNVYVIKRPGVDAFLKAMGEIYEVVIFTASLSKYADPVLDQLDIHRVVQHRLFRESCYNNKGNYVKDLSQLGRPMRDCIIIDNSPASYVFHVNNAVPISSWFNDPHDTELTDLVPFLTDLGQVDDIRSVLDAGLYQQFSESSFSSNDEKSATMV